MKPRVAGLCLLGLGLLSDPAAPRRAAVNVQAACDSLVRTRATDPLHYRQRGDRCEGLYGQDVSGSSSLLVTSLVESFEAIDDTSSRPLLVEWTAPGKRAVTLRARSLKSGLFYRMDTQPIAASAYRWPPDVLHALAITNADVGVTGTTDSIMGGVRREILVPLRIGHRSRPARAARYRMTVWPSVELSTVFLTVARAGANAQPVTYLQQDKDLAYGYYPAERGIDVRLPALAERGIYVVRIAATLKRGGSATSTVLLYHASPVSGPSDE